jgi:hypothetical protein
MHYGNAPCRRITDALVMTPLSRADGVDALNEYAVRINTSYSVTSGLKMLNPTGCPGLRA